MAQVKFVSASRVYGKDAPPAVDALDLDIKDGEFMVLRLPPGDGSPPGGLSLLCDRWRTHAGSCA